MNTLHLYICMHTQFICIYIYIYVLYMFVYTAINYCCSVCVYVWALSDSMAIAQTAHAHNRHTVFLAYILYK